VAETREERRARLARKKREEEQWKAHWANMAVDYNRGRRDGCRIMPLIFEEDE
jgi:hypothetical protein